MVRDKILEALAGASGVPAEKITIEIPTDESHGDYSSNIAMQGGGNPREKATEIIDKLKADDKLKNIFSNIEVAGPGFINFKVSSEYLLINTLDITEQGEKYGTSEVGKDKTVIVEYSSPNIAKGFGIGHLRSTIIGHALFNVYKKLGYNVVGENHYGDWGTQFGMVLAQINKKGLQVENLSVKELEDLYVEFNKEMDANPELRDEAKAWFKKIEDGDPEARRQWQVIKDVSIKEFQRVYDLLDVHIENDHGESFYEDKMAAIIEEFRAKGLSKKSEGAEIVEFRDMPPALLVKSDGTTTYFTRDLAAIRYRIDTWNPSLFIYEVGADQILHFRQVFAAAKMVNWGNDIHFEHVAHGMIRLTEGKMSTRKGKTVKLEAVLDEAINRAREIITKSETNRGLSEDEVETLAKQVGVGAVKYYDLSHTPQSEIIFDWEKMFVLTGNSGPYLQYTYARTQSILEKVKSQNSKLKVSTNNDQLTAEEVGVMRHLVHYPEVIQTVGKMYSPNLLASYLFELAQKYNNFYNKHKVLNSENEQLRLTLTRAVSIILKDGLDILGISAPQKM